ncbi:MAG: PAS domain-containing protein [Bacteroidota bacterium]|nr:PAS domain-containing protein [Bacteroidota bacterium]
MWGRTRATLYASPRNWLDAIHDEDRARILEAATTKQARGEYDGEYRIVRPDGAECWIHDRAFPVKDPAGQVYRIAGIAEDITERKLAEESLRESERKISNLVGNLPGMAYRCKNDKDWTMLYVSDGCYEITGYSPDDLIGNKEIAFNELILEQYQTYLWEKWQKRLSEKLPFEDEYKICTANGEIKWVWERGGGIFNENGELLFLEGYIEDITDRKRAEDALRGKEAFIRAVLDNLPIGIAVNSVDPNVTFSYMNDNFPMFYRTTREKLAESDAFWEAVYEDPGFREEIKKRVLEDCASGDPERMSWVDVPITRQGEKTHFISARNTPVPDQPLMISVVWDVTERKRAEEEIHQRNKEMEILDSFIKTTTTKLELQNILDTALEGAITLTGLEGGILCLVDDTKKVLDLSAAQNTSKEMFDELSVSSIKIGDCLCGKAAETGEPLILWDNASGSEYATHESVRNEGIRFHAAFPLIASGKALGVLCVFARNDFKPTERSLAMLKELCKTVALAIENAKLYKEVQKHVMDLRREIVARKQAAFEIQKMNKQMRQLAARLQSVREEESTRIAREIHDDLGQALTGLKMDLKWLEKQSPAAQKTIKEKIQSMFQLIDNTIQSVRKISTELRPGVLELGLVSAIEWQVKEFQKRTGIKCSFITDKKEIQLTEDQSSNLFRMIQEILTNIIRHANASEVTVNLSCKKKSLLLEVHDNGRGITPEEIENVNSLGLLGLRERTYILGGTIELEGKPGQGTVVKVKVPMK